MTADKITEAGIHSLSKEQYEADPCADGPSLRASIAWKLVAPGSTPAHAAYEHPKLNPNYKRAEKRYFDLGTAAHTLLLGKGAEIKIIAAENYMTKDAKAARATCYANGHTPLLEKEWEQVKAMRDAARQQMQALVDAGTIDAMPFQEHETEQALFWREGGFMCRASLDGFSIQDDAISEYKTTGETADPQLFQWAARRMGYPFKLAFYRRGLQALKISYSPEFRVFVQETKPPYLLSFIRIDDELIMREDERVRQAIKVWQRCISTNTWPGYSTAGYDLGLTDRERIQQEPAGKGQHLSSEDIAATL